MSRKPSPETTSCWTRLVRVQQGLLAAVEQDLKKAGFPPLAWYDALLELGTRATADRAGGQPGPKNDEPVKTELSTTRG